MVKVKRIMNFLYKTIEAIGEKATLLFTLISNPFLPDDVVIEGMERIFKLGDKHG